MIAVFVSIRLNGPITDVVLATLEAGAKKDAGCIIECSQFVSLAIAFPRMTTALGFVKHVLERVSGQGIEGPAIGVECGEVIQDLTPRRQLSREISAELAERAHPGQVLLGPAARQVARPCLPRGFGMMDLGDIRLGNSISADRVCQLNIAPFPSSFPDLEGISDVSTNFGEIPTYFVGRDDEAKRIRRALVESRLVTVTGPAGVGKTALAYWVGFDLMDAYRDGAWRVDFASIPRGGSVPTAIAADLGLASMPLHSASERVQIQLCTMKGLILLDNCEHVLPELREFLPKVLFTCPEVVLLLTSREQVGFEGEQVIELLPFDIPKDWDEEGQLPAAVRLFVSRAKQSDPEFSPSPSELRTIGEICRRVDGLPLAIELAAAQANGSAVSEILARLTGDAKTAVQGTSRHRTLDRAIEGSYSLLSPKEQQFFRNMGVLAGPTCRALAIAAGTAGRKPSEDAEKLLQRIVQTSLVQFDAERKAYRLLAPVKEFALAQLNRANETESVRLKFARAAVQWLKDTRAATSIDAIWFARVAREQPNLAASIESLLESSTAGVSLEMCMELFDFWLVKGPYGQAHTWFNLALEKGKRTADDVALAYNELGLLAGIAGRYEEAEKAFLQSLRLRKKSGDKRGQAAALSNLAIHLRNAGRLKEASDQLRKGLEILGSENPSLRMTMMGNLATFLVELEELEEARDWLDRSMTDNELLQDVWQHACNLGCLGLYELAKNNTGAAQTALSKSLESYRAVGDMQGLLATLEISAFIFLRIGDCETAARLIGGTDKHFLLVGVGRPPGDASRRNEALTVIENSLGKEQAEALYALGAMMTVDEIYDLARSDPGESPGFSI